MPNNIENSVFIPPENKICVVVSGKMYAGKSTFTDLFLKNIGKAYPFKKQPLAQELKYLINKYYGYDDVKADSIKSQLRNDYQTFGTEVVRKNYKDDFWVILALRNLEKYLIFDDVRMRSELESIKKHSKLFFSIRIHATDETRKLRFYAKYPKGGHWHDQNHDHISETGLDGYTEWDYTVKNDLYDEGDLEGKASFIANRLRYKLRALPLRK